MNDVTTLAEEVFTSAEVKQAAMEYFGGDELAATTWMNKYAVKNEQGRFIEKTPVDMHQRMAVEFARMGQKFDARAEGRPKRSEEHTSQLQSLMRISYAVFCLKKKTNKKRTTHDTPQVDKVEQSTPRHNTTSKL